MSSVDNINVLLHTISGYKQRLNEIRNNILYKTQLEQLRQLQHYTIHSNVNDTLLREEQHLSYFDNKAFPINVGYNEGQELCKKETKLNEPNNNTYRIVSFNVHNWHNVCIKPGEIRKDPKYVIDFINKNMSKPNMVLIQEYALYANNVLNNKFLKKSGTDFVSTEYIDRLMFDKLNLRERFITDDFEYMNNLNVIMGKAIYGNNIGDPLSVKVSNPKTDRGLLRIKTNILGNEVYVYNVHLDHISSNLRNELTNLLRVLQMDHLSIKYQIIMGDFNNDKLEHSRKYDILRNAGYVLMNNKTGRAKTGFTHHKEIDLAWVSNEFLEEYNIINEGDIVVKSKASDHYPIYLDIQKK